MSQGQVTHKCVQPTKKLDFYWRQGWISMIMISPHQQYNLLILYSSSRLDRSQSLFTDKLARLIQVRNQVIKSSTVISSSLSPSGSTSSLLLTISFPILILTWISDNVSTLYLYRRNIFSWLTSCTFFSSVPGTFYVPGTFDRTYIGCIGIKKQME